MTGRLVWFQLRQDRRQLLVWLVAIGALVASTGGAILAEFPGEADRVALLRLALATPALLALRGAPHGPSAGSVVFFQLFSWMAVVVGLMNTFLAARHGRAEEEHGRRELLASSPLSRTGPVAATLAVGLLADFVVALVSAAGLTIVGFDGYGSLVLGVALGVTGLAFLGVGVLASQLCATARSANALAGGFVGVAYALRAAGDALGTPDPGGLTLRSAWPSWLSPIGWGERSFALSENRLSPLLAGLVLGAATAGLALLLQSRRDLAQSLLRLRPGPAASAKLSSHLRLTWRLQWPAVLGWTLGGALLGLFTGSLAGAVSSADVVNGRVGDVLSSLAPGQSNDLVGLIIGAIVSLVCLLAAAAGVQSVLRLRGDETDGAAELVLATPLSRRRWLADALVVGSFSVLAVVAGVAGASGLSFLAVGDAPHARMAVVQAGAGAPAALVFVSLTAVLVAVVPRTSSGLAWGLYAVAAGLGLFSALLRLPTWLADFSPFSHIPAVPVESWTPLLSMLLTATALTGTAFVAMTQRELSP